MDCYCFVKVDFKTWIEGLGLKTSTVWKHIKDRV